MKVTHKIYASILTERLRIKIENKSALQETQNLEEAEKPWITCTLQNLIRRELRKKGGRVFELFMNLKAAFDRVHRKVLWKDGGERYTRGRPKELKKFT